MRFCCSEFTRPCVASSGLSKMKNTVLCDVSDCGLGGPRCKGLPSFAPHFSVCLPCAHRQVTVVMAFRPRDVPPAWKTGFPSLAFIFSLLIRLLYIATYALLLFAFGRPGALHLDRRVGGNRMVIWDVSSLGVSSSSGVIWSPALKDMGRHPTSGPVEV
jgi:hypothetical protein